jgi:hypothetical protein
MAISYAVTDRVIIFPVGAAASRAWWSAACDFDNVVISGSGGSRLLWLTA